MSSTRLTSTPARFTVFALVAALLGALLAVIPITGAQAAGTVNYTVAVTSKAGTALSGLTVAAVPIANRGVDPAEVIVDGTPVTGKAGTYLLAGRGTMFVTRTWTLQRMRAERYGWGTSRGR